MKLNDDGLLADPLIDTMDSLKKTCLVVTVVMAGVLSCLAVERRYPDDYFSGPIANKIKTVMRLERESRYADILKYVGDPDYPVGTLAAEACLRGEYQPACEHLLAELKNHVGVLVGGGAEYQQLKTDFEASAWRSLVLLSKASDFNPDLPPDRAVISSFEMKHGSRIKNQPSVRYEANSSEQPLANQSPGNAIVIPGLVAAIAIAWLLWIIISKKPQT